MSPLAKHKTKLREVNRHLVCRLCRGYYVDATTIAECLHSFCRSCIIKYLEKNSFCPICEVQIHTAKPHLSLRQDKALQDVVYKLVPGLYHNEMQRRRDFYLKHPDQITATTPEQCGIEDRIIFSPDEIISLSLERLEREEYVFESISTRGPETGSDSGRDCGSILPQQLVLKKLRKKASGELDSFPRLKRYLRCPAAVDVSHLKKFVRMKYDLGDKWDVDIIHKRVSLPDHYTLMDIAYIYTWKRSGPMRLFFYHADKIEKPRASEVVQRAPVAKPIVAVKEEAPEKEEKKKESTELVNGEATANELREARVLSPRSQEGKPKSEVRVEPTEPKLTNGTVEKPSGVKKEKADDEPSLVNGVATASDREKVAEAAKVKSAPKTVETKDIEDSGPDKAGKEVNSAIPELESVPSKRNGVVASSKKKEETVDGVSKKDEKLKRTIANLLKSYRKESSLGDGRMRVEMKSDPLTNAAIKEKKNAAEKNEADVTIEIKSEAKASEYDFESNSPPGKIISLREFTKSEQCKNRKTSQNENGGWMLLQDFRKVMKENEEQDSEVSGNNKQQQSKVRLVPNLKRIEENRKSPVQKTNGKVEEKGSSPTIINIQTENEDYRKKENRVESARIRESSPPKAAADDAEGVNEQGVKQPSDNKKPEEENGTKRGRSSPEVTGPPSKKAKTEGLTSDNCGAMDLSRSEAGAEATKKNDENMVEALVSAAQKQNIEPLLRVPQFMKTSGSPPKISPGRNISPSDISQALQFFKDLRSDIRVLEAKSQLGSQSEQFSKLNISPFQLYQQQMDLIKRLKKHQMIASEYQQTPKTAKLSPPSEKQKKSPTAEKAKGNGLSPPKEDAVQVKTPVERALTQIQEQFELQNRMKQNLKNLPALLQFYNRPPFLYCPSVSPTKPNQSKMKSPSLSPNVQKSPKSPPSNLPLSMTSPGSSFFGGQSYSPMVNTGLTSEMTFHQMFQNYLSQQEKMNQIKPSLPVSKPRQNPPTSTADFYFSDSNRSPPKQKI